MNCLKYRLDSRIGSKVPLTLFDEGPVELRVGQYCWQNCYGFCKNRHCINFCFKKLAELL